MSATLRDLMYFDTFILCLLQRSVSQSAITHYRNVEIAQQDISQCYTKYIYKHYTIPLIALVHCAKILSLNFK